MSFDIHDLQEMVMKLLIQNKNQNIEMKSYSWPQCNFCIFCIKEGFACVCVTGNVDVCSSISVNSTILYLHTMSSVSVVLI